MTTDRINIHLYQSPFQHESRILRITKSLSQREYFDKIIIIATYLNGLKEVEQIDEKRTVFRIKTIISPSLGSILRYFFLIEWGIRIILKFRKFNIIVINPHSVPTLPIAWYFKRFCESRIVYDTHEIETEQYLKTNIKKRFSKFLEKSFIKYIDCLVVTSDGYAKWYNENYGIKQIAVIKNYSRKRDNFESEDVLRKYCDLTHEDILFIYHGIIAHGRGIEMLLEIFSQISPEKHIVFMGFGPQVDMVKEYCLKYKNIHYHTAVTPEEVYIFVKSCDVGFCIIENLFLSYYYTLPNKLLECLNVGVPVIVSNFPDMKKSIEEFDCGWAAEVDLDSIRKVISDISLEEINEKRKNALVWALKNTWESQEEILYNVYDGLLTDEL
jgi:glycosyltransferase involved in cell wall biosynthesis